MQTLRCDKVVLGAGLYGLYAALRCGKRGERVAVIERDPAAFSRATYANQARVHMGYHYPRSLATALKSARYFERFCRDFGFSILSEFDQVYAMSANFSWTDSAEFVHFCRSAGIRCEEVPAGRYFKEGACDGAFLTTEYTYDARVLRDHFLRELDGLPNVDVRFNCMPTALDQNGGLWRVGTNLGAFEAPFLLNATYAAVNNVHDLAGVRPFGIKYELCEIILCDTNERLAQVGLTVMDGPFFSIMPFGKTGLHSLTSVTFTPHETSYDADPTFPCQARSEGTCAPCSLANCDTCAARPESAWPYMSQLARKYLRDDLRFGYRESLFSMKPILKASEVDDSRPTVVRVVSDRPRMVSVLSGKINTVYDLDPYLDGAEGDPFEEERA